MSLARVGHACSGPEHPNDRTDGEAAAERERDDYFHASDPRRSGVRKLRVPQHGKICRSAYESDEESDEHDAVQRLGPAAEQRDDREDRGDPDRDRYEAAAD